MSDDRNEGGLFSEDYEAQKRENPYLKKNREKAKAEKSRRKKGNSAESGGVSETRNPWAEDMLMETKNISRPEEPPYERKRTFSDWFFEHVKLIAAIATILVVLMLVLVTDVVDVVEDLITQSQQADKEEITLTYVKGLAEKSSPVTWSDLDAFRRDESRVLDSVTWMLTVEGGQYEIWISGVSVNRAPTYVYLFDMISGDKLILGEEDFDTFIREHTKKS